MEAPRLTDIDIDNFYSQYRYITDLIQGILHDQMELNRKIYDSMDTLERALTLKNNDVVNYRDFLPDLEDATETARDCYYLNGENQSELEKVRSTLKDLKAIFDIAKEDYQKEGKHNAY